MNWQHFSQLSNFGHLGNRQKQKDDALVLSPILNFQKIFFIIVMDGVFITLLVYIVKP